MYDINSTIFVSVASYRDGDVSNTIGDLFKNALNPDRVVIGLLNQIDVDDTACFVPEHPQVRRIEVDWRDTEGACWARSRIMQELLRDEDIFFQIDAHSRFDAGWDDTIVNQLNAVGDPKAVLSHYPLSFSRATGEKAPPLYVRFRVAAIGDNKFPLLSNATLTMDKAPKGFEETAFIAGGCYFTNANTVRKVPYDPYIFFIGEEQSYAARLWTHGFNIYLPPKPFTYHDYLRGQSEPFHTVSGDDPSKNSKFETRSVARLKQLFGIEASTDPEVIKELNKYGFGTERSFRDWQFRFGMHFASGAFIADVFEGKFLSNQK